MKVSVVVNCCYEGLLLLKSLESVYRSIDASGLAEDCEIVVVLDRGDEGTARVVEKQRDRLTRVIRTDFGDLGPARNAGVDSATGALVAFIDGDDLWCRSWVGAAWREFEKSPPLSVLHPQFCVFFGTRTELLIHPDWREPYFDPRGLVSRNHWTSSCAADRELLKDVRFPPVDLLRNSGFEDWSWYSRTIALGMRHVTVPNSTHFIRLKAGASMQKSQSNSLPSPWLQFADYLAADDPGRPYDL